MIRFESGAECHNAGDVEVVVGEVQVEKGG